MKEPSNEPSVRIVNRHEAGVPLPIAETFAIAVSVKRRDRQRTVYGHDRDKKHCIREVRSRYSQPSLTIRGTQ